VGLFCERVLWVCPFVRVFCGPVCELVCEAVR
jgi:hypothetical protein